MNSLYDFHDKWADIVEKSYSDGYDALTDHEKVWFNIQCLVQAVNGGGFIDYYSNKEADTVDDCVRALDVIGAANTRRLVERVNGLFSMVSQRIWTNAIWKWNTGLHRTMPF